MKTQHSRKMKKQHATKRTAVQQVKKSFKHPLKRPQTAWNLFLSFKKDKSPDTPLMQLIQTVKKEWQNMNNSEKQPFIQKADNIAEKYRNDLENLDEEGKSQLRRFKKRQRQLIPKRPPNNYASFLQKNKSLFKNKTFSEATKIISQMWHKSKNQ